MAHSLAAMPPSTRSTVPAPRIRPVGAHRLEQVAGLVADRLQRGAREFGDAGIARQPENRAARLGIPIGRAEPDKGRHQIDLLGGIGCGRERIRPRRRRAITFSPSRSHCTAAPAMKIAPSSA